MCNKHNSLNDVLISVERNVGTKARVTDGAKLEYSFMLWFITLWTGKGSWEISPRESGNFFPGYAVLRTLNKCHPQIFSLLTSRFIWLFWSTSKFEAQIPTTAKETNPRGPGFYLRLELNASQVESMEQKFKIYLKTFYKQYLQVLTLLEWKWWNWTVSILHWMMNAKT